jgi:hypothetical protein
LKFLQILQFLHPSCAVLVPFSSCSFGSMNSKQTSKTTRSNFIEIFCLIQVSIPSHVRTSQQSPSQLSLNHSNLHVHQTDAPFPPTQTASNTLPTPSNSVPTLPTIASLSPFFNYNALFQSTQKISIHPLETTKEIRE